MSRRLACEDCLRSDKPTAYQSELGRRVCQACYAEAAKPQPLTAADDPWVNSTAGDMPEALR